MRFALNIVIDGGDGEHVAMVWDSTMAKDDNEVKVASIEVFRVVNGKIVEVWNCGYKLDWVVGDRTLDELGYYLLAGAGGEGPAR